MSDQFCSQFHQQFQEILRLKQDFESAYINRDLENAEKLMKDLKNFLDSLPPEMDPIGYEKREERFQKKAIEFDKKLFGKFDLIVQKSEIVQDLAGIDTPEVWALRDQIMSVFKPSQFLLGSLAGLDSPRAWAFRSDFANGKYPDRNATLKSLAGLDSSRSWEMRKKIMQKNLAEPSVYHGQDGDVFFYGYEELAESLIGLDSAEAWEMREQLNDDSLLTHSLIGLDSERAWEVRNRLLATGDIENILVVIGSLAGVDSRRSWEVRRKFINEHHYHQPVLSSLIGIDSLEAQEFRDRFANDMLNYHELSNSLAGSGSGHSWRLRQKIASLPEDKEFFVDGKRMLIGKVYGGPMMVGIRKAIKDRIEKARLTKKFEDLTAKDWTPRKMSI